MALVLNDRVLEVSVSTGTGSMQLGGAPLGFQSFSDGIGTGNTTYYTITDDTEGTWEVGIGTYNAGYLTRDTIFQSSNGDAKVNFGTGDKRVWSDYPAARAAYLGQTITTLNGYVKGSGNALSSVTTIPNTDITGLGTMSTQNANAVAITGGSVNGTTIGATTPSTGAFTYASTNSTTNTTPSLSFDGSNTNIASGATVSGSYLQNILQNKSGTASASTNYVLSNDLGTDSTYYGEFGMNSSVYSSGTPSDFFSLNNGIYYSGHDGDISVGSGNGKNLYLAWGTTGDKAHVINATGSIGLNTNITGTTNFGTSGQVLTSGGSTATPTWTTAATGSVTSVATAGTVNGITLTGGPITTTGTVTLGGTLNLSSPPTIGNTAPNTGKFTTLESTGTGSFGTTSAQYIQAVGDATYPQIKAAGSGTDIPLVLQPKGAGALQAQLTDSTATGGNARGAGAADFQLQRFGATAVASGVYSAILGGWSNTAAGGIASVTGGQQNSAAGYQSFVGGGFSNATGNNLASVVGGQSNSANGIYNFIGGGFSNSGTAQNAVTTQSATMNATTAVTLAASNASIKVGQLILGTSITAYTYVAAISGTSLTLSQAASGSSTSTLSFYTPHGIVVGGGNNQATGSYSFIGGGGDAGTAANRNVASGDWSFVGGGRNNTASSNFSAVLSGGFHTASTSYGSVVCGGGFYGNIISQFAGNTASGISSFVGSGFGNTASGNFSSVSGGGSNIANASFSTIVGGYYGTTRSIAGNMVFSPSNNPIGTSGNGTQQTALLVLGRQTTDATATVLTSDTSAASGTNQVILPNNSAYYVRGSIVAGVTGGGDSSSWTFQGTIKRGANAAATSLVAAITATLVSQDTGAALWGGVTITADTTNGGLAVTVTGKASTTIRWVCKVETTEMTY